MALRRTSARVDAKFRGFGAVGTDANWNYSGRHYPSQAAPIRPELRNCAHLLRWSDAACYAFIRDAYFDGEPACCQRCWLLVPPSASPESRQRQSGAGNVYHLRRALQATMSTCFSTCDLSVPWRATVRANALPMTAPESIQALGAKTDSCRARSMRSVSISRELYRRESFITLASARSAGRYATRIRR